MTTVSLVQIPYSGAIPGGVHEDLEIEIRGTVPNSAHEGFSVNLCQGAQKESTTVLHISPRFHQNGVALNHVDKGKWGKEEWRELPLNKGRDFDLHIKVKSEEFKIKINGITVDFRHRLSKETAKFLVIDGEVSVSSIFFSELNGDNHGPVAHASAGGPQPINNPPVPLTTEIPGGLSPWRKIYISGVTNPQAKRFTVNLQSDRSGGDGVLHFDVRLNIGNDHNVVVRNTSHGGHFDFAKEERHASHFPFAPNATFDICIQVEEKCYKIDVNGQHFTDFNHRLPVQSVKFLSITGDVKLTQIRFQ